jgi:2-hydroxychromene-2-carboxylate isomerase
VGATETPSGPRGATRTERHLRFRARYVENDLHRYAAAQGLVLRGLDRSVDSTVAGMGLLFVKRAAAGSPAGQGAVDAYIDRVLAGRWSGELDIEDAEAIRRVIAAVGVGAAAFDPAAMRGEYEDNLAALREAGVILAPAYVFGDELFIGRAHLPMIGWLASGKAGPPPI